VAHYFKFHSLADIDAEVQRLGLSLRFSDDFTPLFQPVQVGPFNVANAFCVQPMEGCDGTLDGQPDDLVFRRYERFGAGGAKLIWGEATAVLEEGRANPRQLLINDQTAPGLGKMLQVCRQAHRQACGSDDDLLVGLQLTHSGRYSCRKPLFAVHDPILDPRTRVDASMAPLDDDYLKRLVDHYVRAAKLAFKVGYQFVDVKQCHRYLLSEMLAAKTRRGPFGGSLENRTRLARDIISAIRAEAPGLMIATRMNVYDCIPYRLPPAACGAAKSAATPQAENIGEPCPYSLPLECAWGTNPNDPFEPDLSEPLAWIKEMAQLGVALINISMGSPYATPHVIRPYEYPPPDGYKTPEHPLIGVDRHFRLTAAIQRAFPQLPIVGSGYSYLQEYLIHAAAANVREGRCSFIGVGRATLAQPDFVRQIQEHGKLDRKRICRTFSYCTALMRSKHNELGQFATGCPPFDKEVYGPIWKESQGK
jgi:NADPH2 dehydrogenase